jgi:hypothetical protein
MPKGLRNIEFSVDGEGLTRFGGLSLFQQFCKSLGLRRFLQRRILWPNHSRKYHPVDLFLIHLYAIAAGLGRIENTQSLQHNGLLPALLGIPEFPHRDTLRTFLLSTTPQSLRSFQRAHDRLRSWALAEVFGLYSATIDMDTTSLRIFGRQMQGGVVGYVPHYSHQRCYNVRLLTEAKTGLSLAGELRPGNTLGTVDATSFVFQGLKNLPSRIASSRIRFRADAGFYDRHLIEPLDERKVEYVMVARATTRLQERLVKVRYHRLKKDWQIGELTYQPIHWQKPHHFIAVRKLKSLLEPPVTLFVMKDYAYHILVSNLGLLPERTWRFYNQRTTQELLIKEFKNHYPMTKIPSRKLLANKMYLELLLWTYDLVHLFKHLCLPARCHPWLVSTIRRELWLIPAQLLRTDNKNRLRLPRLFPHQNIFIHAQRAIRKVRALE